MRDWRPLGQKKKKTGARTRPGIIRWVRRGDLEKKGVAPIYIVKMRYMGASHRVLCIPDNIALNGFNVIRARQIMNPADQFVMVAPTKWWRTNPPTTMVRKDRKRRRAA